MATATVQRAQATDLSNGSLGSYTSSTKPNGTVKAQDCTPVDFIPRTITELIRCRAEEVDFCNQPIFSYPSVGAEYIDYTPKQLDAFADNATFYYETLVPRRSSSDEPVQVIGLLGPSNLDYFVAMLALTRLGHTVLFLSTRISEEAHVSLLTGTKATTMLVDEMFRPMSEKVLRHIPSLKVGGIGGEDKYKSAVDHRPIISQLDATRETRNVAWIIHSSGSTSLPKPIFITHSAALGNYKFPVALVGFVTLPLFHAHGISSTFRGIALRRRIYMYNSGLPLTAQHLIKTLKERSDIQIFYSVPYALKLLAESQEGIDLLAKLEVVMFGGSACPKPIGDKLTKAGVMLVGHYGSTETGQLMTSFRPDSDFPEWDWIRPSEAVNKYLEWIPYDVGAGIYELAVLKGWPSLVTSNRDDGGYATKDLFERHPEYPKKNAWRYYARRDDTIVLVNGEKTNPLLLEGAARQSPLVAEAIAFGAQRSQVGLFVLPAHSGATREQIAEAVWPAVQEANEIVPAYARLSKDMIRLLPADADSRMRKTDKGTMIRAAFYKTFAPDIDAIYEEATPKGSLALDVDELKAYLRNELQKTLDEERVAMLKDDTDLFSLGIDSLQATRIRSTILSNIDVGSGKLGQNFVFDFPSIDALAVELVRLRTGQDAVDKLSVEECMQAMIEKYSAFEQHEVVESSASRENVLVTGATGSLGAHLVAQLCATTGVRKIYCLVRARSDQDAITRVLESMQDRKVDVDTTKLVVYASQFSEERLGLSAAAYDAILQDLTCVIHCAWSVNFNLGLKSFENDCIKGTKHLIDLCLRARSPRPASLNFCSSVSAVADSPGPDVLESLPTSLSFAQKMGYAQSKLVTETICLNAAKSTGMKARILRTGQLIGDTRHGIWNAQEAIPMIFRSAVTIGALPQLDERPSWLPVDTAATGLMELSLSKIGGSGVYHVVNDRTFDWNSDLLPMLKEAGLNFESVDRREWVRRLRQVPDPIKNPPFKLVEFFAEKYDKDAPRKGVRYLSDQARAASESLENAPVLNRQMVQQFVHSLQDVWLATKAG
ncbi:acetyl-CoA synthetase-like protein [Acrodontium crateriforme]|uniref:Acetyl-CoA synthetase-like protein n=1 Tax=Acrodontium crateriforme TaxID=150365 RepID=A0AAQ3LXJ7_9PEZI|nr:acetyl-CoA synthetase-like protein [Acrodontium crateriforme]